MTTRCKYQCQSVLKQKAWNAKEGQPYLFLAKFSAVMDNSPENKAFFEATPTGSLEIGMYKQDQFEVGKCYFIDVSLAE